LLGDEIYAKVLLSVKVSGGSIDSIFFGCVEEELEGFEGGGG